jgi:putative ABC transport system ATP-binding protein
LDVETGKLVLEALVRANSDLGTTTVVITHNASIAGLADRVLHMRDGKIAREERNTTKRRPAELEW